MTWYDFMVNDMSVDDNTININIDDTVDTGIDFSSLPWESLTVDKPATYIQMGDERIDEKMIKRMRMLFDALENHPQFKDILADIDTQMAFEEISK